MFYCFHMFASSCLVTFFVCTSLSLPISLSGRTLHVSVQFHEPIDRSNGDLLPKPCLENLNFWRISAAEASQLTAQGPEGKMLTYCSLILCFYCILPHCSTRLLMIILAVVLHCYLNLIFLKIIFFNPVQP